MTTSVNEHTGLLDMWELRQAAAATLTATEKQLERQLCGATPEQVLALLEAFAPGRSRGPEWSRGFDLLVEHVWAWCPDETLVAVEADLRGRGPFWVGLANALSAQNGADVRQRLGRHFPQARLPSFAIA